MTIPTYTDPKAAIAHRLAQLAATKRWSAVEALKEMIGNVDHARTREATAVSIFLAQTDATYHLAHDAYLDAVRLLASVRDSSGVLNDRLLDQTVDLEVYSLAHGAFTLAELST